MHLLFLFPTIVLSFQLQNLWRNDLFHCLFGHFKFSQFSCRFSEDLSFNVPSFCPPFPVSPLPCRITDVLLLHHRFGPKKCWGLFQIMLKAAESSGSNYPATSPHPPATTILHVFPNPSGWWDTPFCTSARGTLWIRPLWRWKKLNACKWDDRLLQLSSRG